MGDGIAEFECTGARNRYRCQWAAARLVRQANDDDEDGIVREIRVLGRTKPVAAVCGRQ